MIILTASLCIMTSIGYILNIIFKKHKVTSKVGQQIGSCLYVTSE